MSKKITEEWQVYPPYEISFTDEKTGMRYKFDGLPSLITAFLKALHGAKNE